MIHDARFPVTCDGKDCISEEDIYGQYYGGMHRGGYNADDDDVRRELRDWIVTDDGKHYCCQECVPETP